MGTHSRSFDPSASVTTTAEHGQRVHRSTIEHMDRLARRMYVVRPGVWCLVGNGLSNQTFVEGPDGLIAIDTGESVEEMRVALDELRTHTTTPIVAVVYTHFHYVGGTTAIDGDVPVYGHRRIAANRARAGGEIAPMYGRGIVHQFGTSLPPDGPDGLVGVGLGRHFRDPAHAPFTPGHVPVDHPLEGGEELDIAGLRVHVTAAPSDADDSVTLWFPDLGVGVHNLLWPALFNVFAIRGEEFRDPRIILRGLDHLIALDAEHLVGTHGPPLSGRDEVRRRATRARDAIQFLWDQTVRGMNLGWTNDELATRVRLPDHADDDFYTTEHYGVAEHHVRQIATGVRGWFGGDTAELFPLEPHERARRLIDGFGGSDAVRARATAALGDDDLRWALELASWLVTAADDRDDAPADDRTLLATVLRAIGQRTTAANIRNWCLTAARDLDGSTDLGRLRRHRLRAHQVAAMSHEEVLDLMRVLLVPARATGVDEHVAFVVDGGVRAGLHVRNSIARPTDGNGATALVRLDDEQWTALVTGARAWSSIRTEVSIDGDGEAVDRLLACFDLAGSGA